MIMSGEQSNVPETPEQAAAAEAKRLAALKHEEAAHAAARADAMVEQPDPNKRIFTEQQKAAAYKLQEALYHNAAVHGHVAVTCLLNATLYATAQFMAGSDEEEVPKMLEYIIKTATALRQQAAAQTKSQQEQQT